MAFCFQRKESVRKAIRRLGCGRIKDALQCLKNCDQAKGIHCARKDIKKVLAVLRLVRAGIDNKHFCRLDKLLGRIAKRLAAPRDAHVAVKTLLGLRRRSKGRTSQKALQHICLELQLECEAEMKRFAADKTMDKVNRELRRARKELRRLDTKGKGWKTIGPGLKASYAGGRRAHHLAFNKPSAKNFHEWRKLAKDLWYQGTVLRRIWPEQMDPFTRKLELLAECLGDDHDLSQLRQTAHQRCAGGHGNRELKKLDELIQQREGELRSSAFQMAPLLYVEKPGAFGKRLAGYWARWRKEKIAPALR